MAKKDNEQVKWLTPTQMAEVFVNKFDTQTLGDITKNIAQSPYEPWMANKLQLFLKEQESNEAELSHDDKKFLDMLETLHYAMTHSETPEAEKFLSSFKFLSQFKYFVDVGASDNRGDLYIKSFLSQIDSVITDSKIKASLLLKCADRAFYYERGADEALVNMLAKNDETITVAQWEYVLNKLTKRYFHNFGVVWTIVEKMEDAAVKEIRAERSKEPYDILALEKISKNIQNMLRNLMGKAREFRDAQEIQNRLGDIAKRYELEKILSADLEALEKLPKSGYEQAAALEAEKTELQRQSRQREAELERQIEELKMRLGQKDQEIQYKDSVIQEKEQQITRLNTALAQSKGETAQVKSAKEKSEADLKELLTAIQRLRGGLFATGVKKAQNVATLIQAERNGK